MDDKGWSFSDNISSITFTPATISRLHCNQPITRKGRTGQVANMSKDSEVLSMVVHPGIWEQALKEAASVATRIITGQPDTPTSKQSEEVKGKIRATMQKLIVIESPTSVWVYPDVKAARLARQSQGTPSVPAHAGSHSR